MSNTVANFEVFTDAVPDRLPPQFAKDLGRIIKALQGAYNSQEAATVIASFMAHLQNFNNPHDVTAAQVPVDGDYILNNIYEYYISTTTDVPPMTFTVLSNKLLNLIQLATSIETGSSVFIGGTPIWVASASAGQYITAALMNFLYETHNNSLAAHPLLQALLTPDVILPSPTFSFDPIAASSDVNSFSGGQMEFLTSLPFIDLLMFALGVPIFPQEPNAPATYQPILDISSYVPVTNGTILIKLFVSPNNAAALAILTLTNPVTGDSISIHQQLNDTGGLNVDISYDGVMYYNTIEGDGNGNYFICLTYDTTGITINLYTPNYTSSYVATPGSFFQFNQMAIGVNCVPSDPNACMSNFAIYPAQLTQAQANAIFGLTE